MAEKCRTDDGCVLDKPTGISPPEYTEDEDEDEDEVQLLPPGVLPYGHIDIAEKAQAVLWHYGVHPGDVKVIDEPGFHRLTDFPLANPEGSWSQRDVFNEAFGERFPNQLRINSHWSVCPTKSGKTSRVHAG